MKQADIMAQAAVEGIVLTESQWERFVENGLFPSNINSFGGREGSGKADYPNAMANLRFIHQTLPNPKLKNRRMLLPYLFWHGYSVDLDKLREYIYDFQSYMRKGFAMATTVYADPDDQENMFEKLSEKQLNQQARRSGRPTKQEQSERKKEMKQLIHEYDFVLQQIFLLADGSGISAQQLMQTLQPSTPLSAEVLAALPSTLQQSIDGFGWLDPKEMIDWTALSELIALIRPHTSKLIAVLTALFPTNSRPAADLFDDPQVITFVILLLLTSRRTNLHAELRSMIHLMGG